MQVEMWSFDRIKPYENNPRINDDAVAPVVQSINEFGFRQPIVVDPDGVIIVGHTRWKAAKQLNLEEVPVHVARDLEPEAVRAYRNADNRTGENAQWDFDLLPIEIGALQQSGFDCELLGFNSDELAKLLEPGVEPGLTDPDDVPEPPDEAITQPGDLWILGDHRLLCGDSTSVEDLDRLLGGAKIHLCNTDPPYNVKVEPRSKNAIAAGNSSFEAGKGKTKEGPKKMRAKDRPLANDFVSDEEFDRLASVARCECRQGRVHSRRQGRKSQRSRSSAVRGRSSVPARRCSLAAKVARTTTTGSTSPITLPPDPINQTCSWATSAPSTSEVGITCGSSTTKRSSVTVSCKRRRQPTSSRFIPKVTFTL